MEFSRTFKRIYFPNRDIEKRVPFSGIIDLSPRSPNRRNGLQGQGPKPGHPILTPVKLSSQTDISEAGKRHYIFATLYTKEKVTQLPHCRISQTTGTRSLKFGR
ncbi:hypothetical protein AVEN_176599-1 [Araneus ventricosus]|uniref:Uncharacterized protein n=1 Tax=Araneus ventricosus TaxID=182803 RepID=A0A4Y2EIL1_ARAVE|nr:hypothetical protein AVEN_176599-1 [Araneus ventricosus]